MKTREFGILLPVFSLGGEYGTGDFGRSAYDFVDFLSYCGVAVWQVLPLCPIGAGGSPYSSPCGDAVNPYFIDLERLVKKGLLSRSELTKNKVKSDFVDYGRLPHIRLLRKAFEATEPKSDFDDYSLFTALKALNGGAPWYEWGECADSASAAVERFMEKNRREVAFWQFVYDEALEDWLALKRYAESKGVKIMGDMPFYVSHDSVEVWSHRPFFELDGYMPSVVAGVPPDYFSKTGQRWGNPIYVWHNKDILPWWKQKIRRLLKIYDILRLDHFRAFDEYYAIPALSADATVGEWRKGPGKEFFDDLKGLPIVAEDLGYITDTVRELLLYTGYPGMRVLQFGFEAGSTNSPSAVPYNSVCYTGTHDNPPLKTFLSGANDAFYAELNAQCDKLKVRRPSEDTDEMADCIIKLGCMSDAKLFTVPLFDLVHSDKRINTPGTVGDFNWTARIGEYESAAARIKELIIETQR